MPNNPYAAPVAVAGPAGLGAVGPAGNWEIGEVLSQAWDIFKQQWAVLVFAPLLLQVISYVVALVCQLPVQLLAKEDATLGLIAAVPAFLVQMFVSMWVFAGSTKLFIAAARGQTPDFGLAFSGMSRTLPLFLGMLLLGLGYIIGLVLLVVPGIILILGCSFGAHYIIDRELGPIEALKKSWETMNGHKGKLFLYFLVSFCIIILGVLACFVGVLVANAVVMLGLAIIYTRISGTAGAPPGGGFGAQPGGYGAPAVAGPGYGPPGGGGYNPPGGGGGYNPPGGGGGYNPPGGGGGYNPPGGGGGYNPPGGGGGYNPPGGGGGYNPPGGGGGYTPPGGGGGYTPPGGGGGYNPPGGGGYNPPGGGGGNPGR